MTKIDPHKSVRASKTVTLNRSRFEKISAVEGIKIFKSVAERFNGYDAAGLSGEQRRILIREKYRKH